MHYYAIIAGVALIVVVKWRDLLLHSFDPAQAMAAGLPVRVIHYGLLCMLSLTIVAALKAVGIAHKSDVHALRLDLQEAESVRTAVHTACRWRSRFSTPATAVWRPPTRRMSIWWSARVARICPRRP